MDTHALVCRSKISPLGDPTGPVWRGEIQCRGLGMKVEVWNDEGKPVVGEKGELVCAAPFPSMPVGFWNDPDGTRYRDSYFDTYPVIWRHGDWIEMLPDGGCVIYGRSDATLNRGGVRMGTSEFYRVVEGFDEIGDGPEKKPAAKKPPAKRKDAMRATKTGAPG